MIQHLSIIVKFISTDLFLSNTKLAWNELGFSGEKPNTRTFSTHVLVPVPTKACQASKKDQIKLFSWYTYEKENDNANCFKYLNLIR